MIPEINDFRKVSCVMADPEGFESAVKELMSMFDREVYDCIIASGPYGQVLGGVLADRMKSGIVVADDSNSFCKKALKAGWKVVIVTDKFEDGKKELELIQAVEGCGCKVIRVGFVAELTACGGRKSKILKKYPYEAIFTI